MLYTTPFGANKAVHTSLDHLVWYHSGSGVPYMSMKTSSETSLFALQWWAARAGAVRQEGVLQGPL